MSKSPGHTFSPELKSPGHTLYLTLQPARSLILTSYCYLPLICILLPVSHPPPGPTERYLVSTLPQNTPKKFRPAASRRAHLSCWATLFLPSPHSNHSNHLTPPLCLPSLVSPTIISPTWHHLLHRNLLILLALATPHVSSSVSASGLCFGYDGQGIDGYGAAAGKGCTG